MAGRWHCFGINYSKGLLRDWPALAEGCQDDQWPKACDLPRGAEEFGFTDPDRRKLRCNLTAAYSYMWAVKKVMDPRPFH